MSMGAVAATLLAALLALHWALAPGFADDGCSGFRHLENGRTFFRYGGLYVTFSCNPGFRIHGYRTSSCVSGQWAREPPLCVAPGCPSPGEILHGSKEVSPDSSVVRFTCNSGFRLFGSPLLYCKGKRWNGTMPVCKESDIMSLFQLKQTSLYESSVELNPDTLPSLKSRFNTIAHTASKEAFLKPSLLGVPQPKLFLTGDVLKVPRKPPEKKPAKKLWSDKATTQGKGKTVGLKETVTRLDIVGKPVLVVDPLVDAQPLPAATFLDTTTTTVPTRSLTPAPLLSRPTGSTILVTPAKNNHEAHTSLRNLDQMLSPSPSGEDGREHHFTSETHRDNNNPVTPLPGKLVAEADISHSTKVNTGSPDKHTLGITSTNSPEVKESELSYSTRKPLTSLQEEDTILHVTVTKKGSSVLSPTSSPDLPVSEKETLSFITSSQPFMVTSSPVIPTGIHDGELPLHTSLATRTDEDLLPRMDVLTAATQPASALHLTESPDVTTKEPYLEHPAESNTHREQTDVDKDSAVSIDAHGMVVGQIGPELNGISRSPRIRPLSVQALQTPLTLKNRTSVTNNHGQENATNNQSVVKETLDLAAKHNLTVATEESPGFLTRKRRPMCPYPPLPAHGTFYFRTIVNPAPFQYKHYVQYACYPGYTLANGDVYSYCLQDKQWSGVTPMCIEETPCSLNNGGCSQVCQVNEQNRAECHCKAGFLLLEDQRTCRDLDECVEGLHQCQQVCENTFGSYRCSCSAGFQLSADRMSCTDIDECMENGGRGPCVSTCMNNPGSFHCACPHGYQVAGDGRACISACPPGYRKQRSASAVGNSTTEPCIDIDECEEMEQRQIQQHRCEWKCVNLPGSHLCVCPRGYTQHPDGYHCKDINECTLKNGGCSHTCLNHRGSFRCACPENYRISPYNRRKCQPIHNSQRSVS